MKKIYTKPNFEMNVFAVEDVVMASFSVEDLIK